ncbi:MAG: ABC transporter permease [Weeksellaceae bacterium]
MYFAQPYYESSAHYGGNLSYPMAINFVDNTPAVESFLMIQSIYSSYKMNFEDNSVFATDGAETSELFFDYFPYPIVAGSYKDAINTPNKIAISKELSNQLFNDTNAVGKIIKIEQDAFTVSLVYDFPEGNKLIAPKFVMLSPYLESDKEEWGNFNYKVLFKFMPGADLTNIKKGFYQNAILKRAQLSSEDSSIDQYLSLYGPNDVEFTPIAKTNLHSKAALFKKTPIKTLRILLSIALIILSLSAFNVINLKTAQASQRAKEVGVRKAIGADKKDLIIQFLLESFIICLFSFLLSLLLLELILPAFNQFMGKEMVIWQRDFFIYAFLVLLLISLIAGLFPALYISNFKPIATLKGNFSRSKNGIWLRNTILSLQIIISSFFIIGGIIIHLQVNYIMNKDLGFNGEQIINIYFTNSNDEQDDYKKYEKAKQLISQLSGVKNVTYGEAIPPGYSNSTSNMDYLDNSIQAQHGSMDFDFLQTMGVELIKGRWLSPEYSSDTINTAMVNEAFIREFGWTYDEALTKAFNPGFDYNTSYKIVGVVKDYNIRGLESDVNPVVFIHYLESEWKRYHMSNLLVKLKDDNIEQTLGQIESLWQNKIEPGYPFDYYFMDKEFAKTFKKYQKQRTLFIILNAIVLLVALLGLFALSALMIEQKLKTVAIKKTLGASDKTLVFDLTKQFLIITTIAVLISIPISYYFMNEWLKDFAYRIEMPWWPYVLSLVILLILTFAVVSFKAYRATQVNLIQYLKYE